MKQRFLKGFKEALLISLVAGLILGLGWGLSKRTEARKSYTPTNLIRLHIIGNSDGQADQDVKLKVRDAILSAFGEKLVSVKDAKEAEKVLSENMASIENTAIECLRAHGFGYGAKARLTRAYFPDKVYQTASSSQVFLPSGEYKALQVVLGKGQGRNWWCIMYPSLCYYDLVKIKEPEKLEQLVKTLDKKDIGELEVLVDELSTERVPLEIRSFFLDALKKGIETFLAAISLPLFSFIKP